MEQERQILSYLKDNEETTQRHISSHTGQSLGAVNLLLKKMVRRGSVKIERLNSRTMLYILTPQGMKEKTKLTYNFVRNSYRQILDISNAVENMLAEEYSENASDQVVLYGPADEIEKILLSTLNGLKIEPLIMRPQESFTPEPHQVTLTWRFDDEEKLPVHSRTYNIMNLI